jgi:hypothetical protein
MTIDQVHRVTPPHPQATPPRRIARPPPRGQAGFPPHRPQERACILSPSIALRI